MYGVTRVQFDKEPELTSIIPIWNPYCSRTFATADINRTSRLFTTVNLKVSISDTREFSNQVESRGVFNIDFR